MRRLEEIRAAGRNDGRTLEELTGILRCTQRPSCAHRHECSDGARELIERVVRD